MELYYFELHAAYMFFRMCGNCSPLRTTDRDAVVCVLVCFCALDWCKRGDNFT